MFSPHTDDEHDSQPLLVSSNHNQTATSTIFAVDDDEDDVDDAPLHSSRSTHSVRFTEQVQVIGPPLRSTLASREAGVCVPVTFLLSYGSKQYPLEFELDSDELDGTECNHALPTRRGHSDQSMPLLVGLFDSAAARRSLDADPEHEMTPTGHYDLEELAAKQHSGGGLVDSIANMANSILGAGECL